MDLWVKKADWRVDFNKPPFKMINGLKKGKKSRWVKKIKDPSRAPKKTCREGGPVSPGEGYLPMNWSGRRVSWEGQKNRHKVSSNECERRINMFFIPWFSNLWSNRWDTDGTLELPTSSSPSSPVWSLAKFGAAIRRLDRCQVLS